MARKHNRRGGRGKGNKMAEDRKAKPSGSNANTSEEKVEQRPKDVKEGDNTDDSSGSESPVPKKPYKKPKPSSTECPELAFWKKNPRLEEELCRLWMAERKLYDPQEKAHVTAAQRKEIITKISFQLSVPYSYVKTRMDSLWHSYYNSVPMPASSAISLNID